MLPPFSQDDHDQLNFLSEYGTPEREKGYRIADSVFNNLPNHYDELSFTHKEQILDYAAAGSRRVAHNFLANSSDAHPFLQILHGASPYTGKPFTVFSGVGTTRRLAAEHGIKNNLPMQFNAPISASTAVRVASGFASDHKTILSLDTHKTILALHIRPNLPFFTVKTTTKRLAPHAEREVILPPFSVHHYRTHMFSGYHTPIKVIHGLYEPHAYEDVVARLSATK